MNRPVYMILRDAAREIRQMHAHVPPSQTGAKCTDNTCPSLTYARELDELATGLVRTGHLGSVVPLPSLTDY